MPLKPGVPKTNCKYEDNEIDLQDVRTSKETFDLNTTGFWYVKHTARHLRVGMTRDLYNPPAEFFKEVAELVRRELGAEKVVVFNWAVRSHIDPKSTEFLFR